MPLQEIIRLFTILNKENFRYCHWKSNANLSKSFESNTDFDLLIAACDAKRFHLCMKKLGMKRRYSTIRNANLGMEDYLGFDETSGKMFHLHIHFKLVIGKKYQKNYRIPIEDQVLNTSICDKNYPIRIIRPELEFVLLIIRSILKVDFGIKTTAKFILKKNIFPSNIRKEYAFLIENINHNIFHDYVGQLFPELSDIFRRMTQGRLNYLSYFQVLKFHKRVVKSLEPYRLFSNCELKNKLKIKQLSAKNSRSWLRPMGMSFAFVGVDGSGKTTTVSNIEEWLGWKLSIRSVYMGFPKNNNILKILKVFIRITNKSKFLFLKEQLSCLRCVFAAILKCRVSRYSEMSKNQGQIVLFERFPLKEFWSMEEPMDGPRIADSPRWGAIERKFYNEIKYPDCVFVLNVNEKESIERKTEHKNESKIQLIKKKIKVVDKLIETNDDRFIIIDTLNGQEQTLREIKRKIWGLL